MKKLFLIVLLLALATPALAVKNFPDAVLDASLDLIDNTTRLYLCTADPTNHAGIAGNCFFYVTVTAGAGSGDWTKGDATSGTDGANGRKLTMAAQADNTITGSANPSTVTHLCFDDATTYYGCTTTTSQAVNDTEVWSIPTFKIVFADPT